MYHLNTKRRCEGEGALTQIIWEGCEVSILEDMSELGPDITWLESIQRSAYSCLYFNFLFPYSYIGRYSKWSFPMHILCAPQFHLFHIYTIPLFFFLYLSVRRTLYLICFFTLKALHTSKYLCWPLPHFFNFYHNTFKIEESELPTVFKINRYCGIILFFLLLLLLVWFLFCFVLILLIIISIICFIIFTTAVHQADIQKY